MYVLEFQENETKEQTQKQMVLDTNYSNNKVY